MRKFIGIWANFSRKNFQYFISHGRSPDWTYLRLRLHLHKLITYLPNHSTLSQTHNFRTSTPEHFGTGIYLVASLLNHSCSPNCTVVFQGRQLSIVATKDIPAGEETSQIIFLSMEFWEFLNFKSIFLLQRFWYKNFWLLISNLFKQSTTVSLLKCFLFKNQLLGDNFWRKCYHQSLKLCSTWQNIFPESPSSPMSTVWTTPRPGNNSWQPPGTSHVIVLSVLTRSKLKLCPDNTKHQAGVRN